MRLNLSLNLKVLTHRACAHMPGLKLHPDQDILVCLSKLNSASLNTKVHMPIQPYVEERSLH